MSTDTPKHWTEAENARLLAAQVPRPVPEGEQEKLRELFEEAFGAWYDAACSEEYGARARAERDIAAHVHAEADEHGSDHAREVLNTIADAILAGKFRDPGALPKSGAADEREATCPGPDCPMCNGEACDLCGAGCSSGFPERRCEHDVDERHEKPRAAAPSSEPAALDEWAHRHRQALAAGLDVEHEKRLREADLPRVEGEPIPSSEPVERDPDDDSAWPLPRRALAWRYEAGGDGWYVVDTETEAQGRCNNGIGYAIGTASPFGLFDIIVARNLAARAARAKAAADDGGGT